MWKPNVQLFVLTILIASFAEPLAAQIPPFWHPPEILEPTHITTRGDFDVHHYELKPGNLIKFKTRGIYIVEKISDVDLVLQPSDPIKHGVLHKSWTIPFGRTPIGNRNYLRVRKLESDKGRALIQIEYKTRWHWWDALAF